jgi:hypothetical protein
MDRWSQIHIYHPIFAHSLAVGSCPGAMEAQPEAIEAQPESTEAHPRALNAHLIAVKAHPRTIASKLKLSLLPVG